jgi:hypothetical protein
LFGRDSEDVARLTCRYPSVSERHGVDDLAAFIRDCDRPARVMPHLMQQSSSEFCCGLVSRSLGCQRVR